MKKIKLDLSRVDLFTVDPDQPVDCPECGARTEPEDVDISGCSNAEHVNLEGFQRHLCLNRNCTYHEVPFFTEFEAELTEEQTDGNPFKEPVHVDHFETFPEDEAGAIARCRELVQLDSTYSASVATVTASTDYAEDGTVFLVVWVEQL